MALALYSPEDVIIMLGGLYQLTGTLEGSFVSIEENSDKWSTRVTTDGRVTRIHKKDPTHTVQITLTSTANDNSILSSMASADNFLKAATIPLFIKDTTGNTMFYSPVSWIEKSPEVVFSTGVEGRQWTLKTAGAISSIGGNESGSLIPTGLAQAGFIAADFIGLV